MAGFAAYGKMPALGDFMRIGAAPGFVAPWDRWVQAALLAGRQVCGARWQDCYFSAPIWRFTLSPGLAGPRGVLGVMMPSVDRVGREFPLTLFTGAGTDPVASHDAGTDCFAALEEIALDALSDEASRDSLTAALDALPPLPATPPQRPPRLQSCWSALIDDSLRSVTFDGLPSPRDSVRFFDLADGGWQAQDLTA